MQRWPGQHPISRGSEFGKKLPALLEKRSVQLQVVQVDVDALTSEWGLTE